MAQNKKNAINNERNSEDKEIYYITKQELKYKNRILRIYRPLFHTIHNSSCK